MSGGSFGIKSVIEFTYPKECFPCGVFFFFWVGGLGGGVETGSIEDL